MAPLSCHFPLQLLGELVLAPLSCFCNTLSGKADHLRQSTQLSRVRRNVCQWSGSEVSSLVSACSCSTLLTTPSSAPSRLPLEHTGLGCRAVRMHAGEKLNFSDKVTKWRFTAFTCKDICEMSTRKFSSIVHFRHAKNFLDDSSGRSPWMTAVVIHDEPWKHHRLAKLWSLWLALELATLEHVLFGADVNASRAHHAHSKR